MPILTIRTVRIPIVMEIAFRCDCGEEIADPMEGDGNGEATIRVQCGHCDAVYAVTVTTIVAGEGADETTPAGPAHRLIRK